MAQDARRRRDGFLVHRKKSPLVSILTAFVSDLVSIIITFTLPRWGLSSSTVLNSWQLCYPSEPFEGCPCSNKIYFAVLLLVGGSEVSGGRRDHD